MVGGTHVFLRQIGNDSKPHKVALAPRSFPPTILSSSHNFTRSQVLDYIFATSPSFTMTVPNGTNGTAPSKVLYPIARESPALFLPLSRATPSFSPPSLLVRVIPTRSGMSPSHIPPIHSGAKEHVHDVLHSRPPHQNLNNTKRHDTNMSTAIRSPMPSSMPASRRTRSPRSPARLPPRPV